MATDHQFKVGDRAIVARHETHTHLIGREVVITNVGSRVLGCDAADGSGEHWGFYPWRLDPAPQSPFHAALRAYIQRELPSV